AVAEEIEEVAVVGGGVTEARVGGEPCDVERGARRQRHERPPPGGVVRVDVARLPARKTADAGGAERRALEAGPTAVRARVDDVDLRLLVVPALGDEELAGERVHGEGEGVAEARGEETGLGGRSPIHG